MVDSIAFRYAYRLYLTGNYTDRDIAEALNNYQVEMDGKKIQVRSRGRTGQTPGPFTKDTTREMLQNPYYTGVVAYRGSEYNGEKVIKHKEPRDINEGQHVPLISRAEFAQEQQIREARGKAPQGRGEVRQAARVYILGGVLDCARCEAPMHCQDGRYMCSTRIQRKGGCDQPSAKDEMLEVELAEQMARVRLPEEWQEAIVGYLLEAGGLEAIMAQRRALQEHFDNIQFLYSQDKLGRQVYLREWHSYQRGMAALSLENRTDLSLDRAWVSLADFGQLWRLLTPLEQKAVAQSLLKVARVDDGHIVEWHWYPPFHSLFASA
jgi:hypothetical protein